MSSSFLFFFNFWCWCIASCGRDVCVFTDKVMRHNPLLPGLLVHTLPVLNYDRTNHNTKPMEHLCIAIIAWTNCYCMKTSLLLAYIFIFEGNLKGYARRFECKMKKCLNCRLPHFISYCKSGNLRPTLIFALSAHFWASAKLKSHESVYFVCRSM